MQPSVGCRGCRTPHSTIVNVASLWRLRISVGALLLSGFQSRLSHCPPCASVSFSVPSHCPWRCCRDMCRVCEAVGVT